ncbi:MAG: GNAT family N-acetyltransferase [Oscillospiraceae bacterium]|nr:GNAT family N-acetyltransferase [Oscillospiraceae bacterium]
MNKELLFKNFPILESEELNLKKVEPCDAEDLYEILTNVNLYRYKPGNPLKSLDAVTKVIGHYERDFNKHKTIFLGIYDKNTKNKLIGIGEIFGFDYMANRVEVGYTLNEHFWGKGFATSATKLMLDYLFNKIGVNSIQAMPMPENVKSCNVLKRCGFVHEGTLRQCKHWTGKGIVDLEMYSILKSDYIYSKLT